MKKALALMLCLVVAISLLAACGKTPDDTPATDESGRPVITIGLPENPSVVYTNNTYTKLIEELSGCKIEFEFFQNQKEDYTTQLSARTAANEELPDILWGFNGLEEETRNSYGQDGFFIDILPLLMDKEKSAIFWERFSQADEAVQKKVLVDMVDQETGEAYGVPGVLFPYHDYCAFMASINQDWLTRLNLPNPENIEQLEDVLRAFRDKDANGNGDPTDEIPFMGQRSGTGARSLDYFINLFTYYNTQEGYFQVDDNGNVICTATTDIYRQALQWVYDMVKEGLIHSNTFTNGSADISYYFTSNIDRIGATITHPQIGMSSTTDLVTKFVPLKCLNYAPKLQGQHLYCTHITSSCKDIDAAWKVIMAMCTKEARMHAAFGVYGENWVEADPGSMSADGYEATVKIINGDKLPTSNRWLLNAVGVLFPEFEQKVDDPNKNPNSIYLMENLLINIVKTYDEAIAANNPDPQNICPQLIFTAQDRLDAPGFDEIPTVIDKWRSLFMAGTLNPYNDADWEKYLNALDKSGFKDYMEVAQIIYERTLQEYA